MTDVETHHYSGEAGDGGQRTVRRVTVSEDTHEFEVTDDGHEYLGDGSPPESAEAALHMAGFTDSVDGDPETEEDPEHGDDTGEEAAADDDSGEGEEGNR